MPAKHYAITRVKKFKNAWTWVVTLGRSGKLYYKGFTDLKHGGKGAALAAALKWRDEMAVKNVLTWREHSAKKHSYNTSGAPGVHRLTPANQPMGIWRAAIKSSDGRRLTKSFSIKRCGEREAFRLAVAARQVMLDGLDDRPYLRSLTAKRLVRNTPPKQAKLAGLIDATRARPGAIRQSDDQ